MKKITDASNPEEHYKSFLKNKNKILAKGSKITTHAYQS